MTRFAGLFLSVLVWIPVRTAGELFRDVASETGLEFEHFIGATGRFYLVEEMGPGAALFDYDNDGDLDAYLLQGALLEPGAAMDDALFPPPRDHWPGNRLYRNELIESGSLRFTDVTDKAGVGDLGFGVGAAVGDYDNDGFVDLFVSNFGANVLYRNRGDGAFENVSAGMPFDTEGFSSSAAFVDYDGDGDLDLYVARYNGFSIEGNKSCYAASGKQDYCQPQAYFPLPDRLYRNDEGKFVDVSREAGIANATGTGLGVVCADFNGDGRIDIYVANDAMPNFLWINQGDGTFVDDALFAGVAFDEDGKAEAGMGVDAADFDDDGDFDIFLTHLRGETNTLYVNDGSGLFDDLTRRWGLDGPSLPATGFGTGWLDYDNDGRLDLFTANGSIMRGVDATDDDPFPYSERNQLYRQVDGKFEETTATAGREFERREVSRGAAFGDVDNDGDIDILIGNCNGPARLLLNETASSNAWLRVKLVGAAVNRDGYGAVVSLSGAGRRTSYRRAGTDGSYLSASSPLIHFGLGSRQLLDLPLTLRVNWPDGASDQLEIGEVDRVVTVRQGTARSK